MNKLLAALVCAFAASAVSAATYEVFITGPGGHSNGSYGNTNAVHAGSRRQTSQRHQTRRRHR